MFNEPTAADRRAHWDNVVVLIGEVDSRVVPALRIVSELPGSHHRALHVAYDVADGQRVAMDWLALGVPWLPLEVCDGTGSSIAAAAAAAILDDQTRPPDVTVVLPELSAPQWWYPLLHRQRSRRISAEMQVLGFATLIVPSVLQPATPRRLRAAKATPADRVRRATPPPR